MTKWGMLSVVMQMFAICSLVIFLLRSNRFFSPLCDKIPRWCVLGKKWGAISFYPKKYNCNDEDSFNKLLSADPDPDADDLRGGLSRGYNTSCVTNKFLSE